LVGERLLWGSLLDRLPRVLQHLYVIVVFVVGWVFFRIDGLPTMAQWLAALFGAYGLGDLSTLNAAGVLHFWPWFLVAAIGSTAWPRDVAQRLATGRFADTAHVSWMALMLAWSAVAIAVGGFNPFIYFRF
jgi:alginate O-acetyltransferase complex protein AlgI